MARYDLLCRGCGAEWEHEKPMRDPLPHVHECGGKVVQVVSPPRSVGVGDASSAWAASDREFDRDAAAYKRLRADGLQPKSVGGSAILEAGAETRNEVENKRVVPDRKLRNALDRGTL